MNAATRHIALIALLLIAVADASAESVANTGVDATRIEVRIKALSAFGRNADGGVDRVAFSEADRAGREYIQGLMRAAGLQVRIDAAGNIIGRRDGSEPALAPILFGSHIDSVPGGGNYDGDVGVIGALEAIEVLQAQRRGTRHPLEMVVFTDEEGGTVGSKAMAGHDVSAMLDTRSHSGRTIREGLRFIGGNPDRLADAARKPGAIAAYVELHIEQGARLAEAGIDIGVVQGIVGIARWDVTVTGETNHAGTTPMPRRKDALAGASELVLAIERTAKGIEGTQVATVGRIQAEPGAPNVIPGRVTLSLEIRDLSRPRIDEVFAGVRKEADAIAAQRGLQIGFADAGVDNAPALSDPAMRERIAAAARGLGLSQMDLQSGAGHDAQEIAAIAPMGMIFVPSQGGISHSPREFTRPGDMANGAAVLLQTVLALDRAPAQGEPAP